MEVQNIIKLLITGLLLLFGTCLAYDPATCIQCRESHMCNPPDCFCCRDQMPLQSHNIPQMVFFTFDDAVNPQVANYYRQLFSPKRTNPNGCPISMTLFVSHRNTVYGLVKEFYEKGMEIASHSVTHSHMNSNTFIREARKQKENLSKRAGIPSEKIVGWRSPFLEPVGDLQPSVLKDLGYEYDATLTMAKKDPKDKAITPFTLDFGWPYDCKIKPCPTQSHKGFWEVPVVSVKDYLNKYDCVYVDGCNNPPPTENMAYKFLWDNFQKYYTTNRAPMGINMHASWFYYPERKAAMDRFIKELVKLDDTYVVSVKQVIEWLRNPTTLSHIKSFPPWQCNGNSTTTTETKTGNVHFESRHQRQRSKESAFRPQGTRMGFVSNVPQPSFPPRTRQTPRPQQRQQPHLPNIMPTPVPPMVPNLPMVRFWWRPPNMVDPARQMSMQLQEQQRQETLRRRRLEEERQRRIQAEEQTRAREQKRQEELRQKELTKQAEILKRQKEIERKRLEEMQFQKRRAQEFEKQRQLELEKKQRLEAEQKKKAEEARIKELRRKEFAKQREIKRNRQTMIKPGKLPSVPNLHEHEFLYMSEVNSHQTSAPLVLQQPLAQSKNPHIFENSVRNNKQIHKEINKQRFTQTPPTQPPTQPPTTTIDHKSLEESFHAFISMKLDEILEYRPSERTKHLELLSIAELRALQEELRNRLVNENLSSNQNQSAPVQSVNEQNKSVSAKDSQPIQNEIQPHGKPMMNEFHTHSAVKVTKINELQALQSMNQEYMKDSNIPYIDPIVGETFVHVPETAQLETRGQFSPLAQLNSTRQSTIEYISSRKTLPTTSSQQTTTKTTTPKTTSETSTTPTTTTTTAPATTTTTKTTTSTTAIPTNKSETSFSIQPTTMTIPTTTSPTSMEPTTTTKATTTTETTTGMTTTSSTKKFRIPVVQRWTVLQNKKVPWQRWLTEVPGESEFQTTTPQASKTITPSARNFTVKSKQLFRDQSLNLLSSNSKTLNEIPDNQGIANNTQNNIKENKQQPKAFVNEPLHFDINYDINGHNQPSLFSGISFNGNHFLSPIQPRFGAFHIPPIDSRSDSVKSVPVSNRLEVRKTFTPTTTTSPTTTNLSKTTLTQTTAAKATTKQQHSRDTLHNPASGKSIKQDPISNEVQVKGQDVSYVVESNTFSANDSATQVSNTTQQLNEPNSQTNQLFNDYPNQNIEQLFTSSKCMQEVNCKRPGCVCKETTTPGGMSLLDTPQIVYITVDGSLNFHTYGKMRSLFSRSRMNPNGCRIKGTVFVTDTGSSYQIANVLQKDGVEIGMMGVSSRPYTDARTLKEDLILQRKRIAANANMALNDVKGWRSPGFSPVGDEQFNILANHGLYDSSLLIQTNAKKEPIQWPHTLDFGWTEPCEMGTCPKNKHIGVWEVPAIPFSGPKNSTSCEYIDACTVQPETKQETLDYLMDNFNAYYKTNKAPFAIRLKQIWFHWYYRENFAGLLMFLDKILSFGDVYITSVADTLEWMKTPKLLKDLKQFEKWKC